jgi:hypothetical protein
MEGETRCRKERGKEGGVEVYNSSGRDMARCGGEIEDVTNETLRQRSRFLFLKLVLLEQCDLICRESDRYLNLIYENLRCFLDATGGTEESFVPVVVWFVAVLVVVFCLFWSSKYWF